MDGCGLTSHAMAKAEERQAKITRVSITSIVMNIALSLVKAAVGAASGSVAIINDAAAVPRANTPWAMDVWNTSQPWSCPCL